MFERTLGSILVWECRLHCCIFTPMSCYGVKSFHADVCFKSSDFPTESRLGLPTVCFALIGVWNAALPPQNRSGEIHRQFPEEINNVQGCSKISKQPFEDFMLPSSIFQRRFFLCLTASWKVIPGNSYFSKHSLWDEQHTISTEPAGSETTSWKNFVTT